MLCVVVVGVAVVIIINVAVIIDDDVFNDVITADVIIDVVLNNFVDFASNIEIFSFQN